MEMGGNCKFYRLHELHELIQYYQIINNRQQLKIHIYSNLKMNPQQELRRKYGQISNYKSTVGTATIITNKEWKRSDISRQKQKQQKKPLIQRQPLKINTHILQQGNCKTNAKTINFKNLKETVPKKQQNPMANQMQNPIQNPMLNPMQNPNQNQNTIQNQVSQHQHQHSNANQNAHINANTNATVNGNKNLIHGLPGKSNVEYFGKNINLRSPPTEGHGISINVNIQNMIQREQHQRDTRDTRDQRDTRDTRDNDAPMLSDRSGFGEDKKVKKILPNTGKIDDFECKQQLVYKRTPLQKQNKFPDKTIQKRPLIDRKQHIKAPQPQQPQPHTQLAPQSHTHLPPQPHTHLPPQTQTQAHQSSQKCIKFVVPSMPSMPVVAVVPDQKQKQIKEQLKKFQSEIEQINSAAETESINYLDYRQQSYLIPPYYIEKNQKNFSWKMRVTLFQWMMHVSYEFSLKRQTFYIATNLVDLFLSKERHLQRTDFQLAGTASMFIASKLQQFQPKCSDQFAKATKKYTAAEVKEMQKRICKTLRYTLNPPTLSAWANRLMLQWDTFLQQNNYCQKHPLFATCQPKYFKKCDTESYRRYRTVMQFLDCATLDIQTIEYQPKLLVCAFMYLVLGNSMNIFPQQKIWREFPRSSLYLLDEDNLFNDLYINFLQSSFNMMLIDLLPAVQYSATYYGLVLNFQDPVLENGCDLENIDFQDYCSFQTYNPSAKNYVFNTRWRGMYE